jgi:hypothetical protein
MIIRKWDVFIDDFSTTFGTTSQTFLPVFRAARIRGAVAGIIALALTMPMNYKLRQSYCSHHINGDNSAASSGGQLVIFGSLLCSGSTLIPTLNVIHSFATDVKDSVLIRLLGAALEEVRLQDIS